MAIQQMVLTCDYCETTDEELLSEEEAQESGWYIVRGPERELGGRGERVYCELACLHADLL